MKKFSNKKVEKQSNLIVESKKKDDKKSQKLQDKLLELEDSEIEALFEAGRITKEEYEYILNFRKKQKDKKKSEKEKFEERIRCNNQIIEKIVNLGRKFRVEDLIAHGNFEEARKVDTNKEFVNQIEEEYKLEERYRDKTKESRGRLKQMERESRGRGRERDSR